MYFKSLQVENFRSVRSAYFSDLTSMVVIAGPNGCGKSTLFDAIRLLKSVYGGYQPNEWQSWFNEFQINLNRSQPELFALFQDQSKPLKISLEVVLSDSEKEYISKNTHDLLSPLIWSQFIPDAGISPYRPGTALAAQYRNFKPEVEEKTKKEAKNINELLSNESYWGEVIIPPGFNSELEIEDAPILELLFSQYLPQHLGIVDYHGPQRTYQREQIGGINLNIQTTEQQSSQHALYNYAGKYSNIKSEMASNLIREYLSKEAGGDVNASQSLISTLSELFATFFPGKEFGGPKPTADGKLRFPVVTNSGFVHDINDLSSGEKEVLYGYLRLYNLSPHHSVLLLDEPELHLNPRLIKGLPQFYHKYLGKALDNQIWLLTHSDAILREALTDNDFSVFHLQLPNLSSGQKNQAKQIQATEELDRAVIDLIGDLATYRPDAKVVLFEGGGDSEFDVYMVSTLFPEFAEKVNTIAVGNKMRVRQLNSLLRKAKKSGAVPATFYAIVDRDLDTPTTTEASEALSWNVYHIENYLIEPSYILEAMKDTLGNNIKLNSKETILDALKNCAKETLPKLVLHKMQNELNNSLVSCITLDIDPSSTKIATNLFEAIQRTSQKINHQIENTMTIENLELREEGIRKELDTALLSGAWITSYRGRDILKLFVRDHCKGMKYEQFRNIILSKMRDSKYQPEGMKSVLQKIVTF